MDVAYFDSSSFAGSFKVCENGLKKGRTNGLPGFLGITQSRNGHNPITLAPGCHRGFFGSPTHTNTNTLFTHSQVLTYSMHSDDVKHATSMKSGLAGQISERKSFHRNNFCVKPVVRG